MIKMFDSNLKLKESDLSFSSSNLDGGFLSVFHSESNQDINIITLHKNILLGNSAKSKGGSAFF